MAANQYKPGELTADFIFKTSRKSCNEEKSEEVDGASDNLSLESDNRPDLLNQIEVLPETITKRKLSSDLTIRQPTSAKKSIKNTSKVRA